MPPLLSALCCIVLLPNVPSYGKINLLQAHRRPSTVAPGVAWKQHRSSSNAERGTRLLQWQEELTNQGARLLTCKCKRTGDGCRKNEGHEGCLLKGGMGATWQAYPYYTHLQTDLWGRHQPYPLPQDVHVLGPRSSHGRYCKTAQSLGFPFPDPEGNSYEETSMFREWTFPFVHSTPWPTPAASCINTSDSNPGKCIAFLYPLLGKKDVCT